VWLYSLHFCKMPHTLNPKKKMRLLPLVAATFFMVSGGPYGLEELVQKTGFGSAILILLMTPVIWSVPTALMLGELSSAIPEEGGFYVWVTRALGPFWGFQEAWLSLAASIFDMAIYPTLFVLYLSRLWPWAGESWHGVLIGTLLIAACAAWNLLGASAVGESSIWLGLALLSPFAGISVAGIFHIAPIAQRNHSGTGGDLLGGVVIAMWNYMGWDNASTVASEVEDPQRTYPTALLGAVALVTFCYVAAVAAVSFTSADPSAWETGSWVNVAQEIAGPWLGLAVTIGGMICGAGMLNSLVMSYSRLPLVLAEDGYLPKMFTKTLANGAPWVAILVCALTWALSLGLSFEPLVLLDVLLYGVSLLLEFAALIALRIREPELPRPFKVPGGMPVAAVLGIAPAALFVLAFVRNRTETVGSLSSLHLALAMMALGPVFYFAKILVAQRAQAKAPEPGPVSPA
jgi:amino acid transporter